MTWHPSVLSILLIIASVLGGIWALAYEARYYQWIPAKFLGLLMLVAGTWSVVDAFQLSSTHPIDKLLWFRVQVMVSVWITTFWLFLALACTHRLNWLRQGRWIAFTVVPLCTMVVAAFDTTAQLFIQNVQFVSDGPNVYFGYEYGPALIILSIYTNVLQIVATGMLAQLALRSRQAHGRQVTLLIICYVVVLASYLSDASRQMPVTSPRLFPLTVLALVPIAAQLLNRARRADLAPLGRGLLVDQMPDPVIVLDEHDFILDLSLAAQLVFGCSLTEVLGHPISRLDQKMSKITQELPSEAGQRKQLELSRGDRQQVFDVRGTIIADWRHKVIGRALVLRDITERVQAEERTKVSLTEKEVLLKEVHHRVKNNLQVISSLLSLQASKIQDTTLQAEFQDSQDRVHAMALIHERLYRSDDLAQINFASYLQELTCTLFQTYQRMGQHIAIAVLVDGVFLDIDTAIPCGLLVNELVSNALKHAFPSSVDRKISVSMHRIDPGKIRLIVQDNGVGLPTGFDFRHTASLGLKLVNSLSRQLNAALEITNTAGTKFEITFPEKTTRPKVNAQRHCSGRFNGCTLPRHPLTWLTENY